tara:strand:- start:84 stop:1481 length:1398 start_codon:yes stop_codon:yes gene_type:complete
MTEHKISASQIKTAFDIETGCKRKWAFNKIEGIRSPATAATTLGTNVHTVAEDYLNSGTVPDLKKKQGRIFASGLHLVPDRKLVTGVEENFNLRFNEEVTFHGIIDFIGDDFVGDHKTTSNFKYMLTEEKLKTDPQGVLYGMHLATSRNFGLTDKFYLQWIYYLTKGKNEAREVKIETNRLQLEMTYFPIAEQAAELVELRKTKQAALDVEPNYRACGAFGGCPFISKCQIENQSSVYDFGSLNQNTEEKTNMSSLMERLQAKSKITKTKNTETQNEKPDVVETVNINPPMAEVVRIVEPVKSQNETEEKTEKKKRGRPPGSKNKKIEAILTEAKTQIEKPEEQTAKCDDLGITSDISSETVEKVEYQNATGYTLFINCAPSSGAQDLTARLSQIANQCATDNDVEHYRFIKFGQAKATFANYVRKSLQADPLHGSISVDSMNLMISDCLEELISGASDIVRAFR